MVSDDDQWLKYDFCGLAEKIRKYGDPTRNLIITILIIIFLGITIFLLLWKKDVGGITAEYAVFYPTKTTAYIDVEIDSKKIEEFNRSTGLNIKDLSELLSKVFRDNYTSNKAQTTDKIMSETFGDSFSFGTWNNYIENKPIERSLAIFSVEREGKIDSLFELLSNQQSGSFKRERNSLINKTFKGYRITSALNGKGAYLIRRNKLFLADSVDTLKYVIENSFLKNEQNLYKRADVRKSLNHLVNNRIGTIILSNYDTGFTRLNKITDKNILNSVNHTKIFSNIFDPTVISITTDKNMIYLKSYTPYNLLNISNESLKKVFEDALNSKDSSNAPEFLPLNTAGFISVGSLKNIINLFLESSGIKQKPEFNQTKLFLKMFTNLDFDNDILEMLSEKTVFASVNADNNPKHVLILSNNEKVNPVFSKLSELASSQISSVKNLKQNYKGTELDIISSPGFSSSLCYGEINKDLYAVGEKLAVESLIDSLNNKQGLAKVDFFKQMIVNDLKNKKLSAYVNIQNFNKINKSLKLVDKSYIDRINNKVESILFTLDTNNNVLQGTFVFYLKSTKS